MNQDHEHLVAYLLGELPEQEQLALEQDYFTSDDSYTNLLTLEDELAYDYAENRLPPERRRRFEATIGATERGRKNVELARAMLAALRASQGSGSKTAARYWAMGIAAALVVAIAAGGLVLRQEISQLRVLAEAKPAPIAAPVEAAFLLTPGLSRGGEGVATLELRPEADVLRLDLLLPPGIRPGDYAVEIRANDRLVSSQSAQTLGRTLSTHAAAKLFSAGNYEVSVRRLSAGEQPPELAAYAFRLIRR